MSNGTVSIIIPVYNVDAFIDACFQSILKQSYQDFEVLITDDGSTDKSGEICDRYAQQDSRFHVWHTQNNGIGKARNLALENAIGEYCFFLDPDDLLGDDALAYLVSVMEKNHSDVVLGVSKNFSGAEPDTTQTGEYREFLYTTPDEIITQVVLDKWDLRPLEKRRDAAKVNYEFFSSLYRMKLLKENDIRFLEISYGEDTYVCFKSLLCTAAATTTERITYWHRKNMTSTTYRYHAEYLEETKKYYDSYCSLFRNMAPKYADKAIEGLNAQYYLRCISAVEREYSIGSKTRSVKQMRASMREVSRDPMFRKTVSEKTIRLAAKRTRIFVRLVRCRMNGCAAVMAKLLCKIRKMKKREGDR